MRNCAVCGTPNCVKGGKFPVCDSCRSETERLETAKKTGYDERLWTRLGNGAWVKRGLI